MVTDGNLTFREEHCGVYMSEKYSVAYVTFT